MASRNEPQDLTDGKWLETDQFFAKENVVNTTDEGEHLELEEESAGVYHTSGFRTSLPLDLDAIKKVESSNIKWTSTEPTSTDLKIYTAISDSNTVEPNFLEDFTTYTEVDPNSRITVAENKVSWTNLSRDETAYVYKDMGVDYFSGDFEHDLEVKSDGTNGSLVAFWNMANVVKNFKAMADGSDSNLCLYHYQNALRIYERDGASEYSDGYTFTANTTYYVTIKRDESVGTHGTIYAYIYSDSARTTLLDTLSIALHTSKKDFRYIYAVNTYNSGSSSDTTGHTENLDLGNNGDWDEEVNNTAIDGISVDDDLTGKYLWVRQELSTTATASTPRLTTLEYEVVEESASAETHTVDTLLQKIGTEEHTVDTNLFRRESAEHTVDTNIEESLSGYSYADELSLPTTTDNLSNSYSSADETKVATLNGERVNVTGQDYLIHQFKEEVTVDKINATWVGQSTKATTESAIVLQVYNQTTTEWETLTSNNTTGANTNVTLNYLISDLTNYKDGNNVYFRVYQKI